MQRRPRTTRWTGHLYLGNVINAGSAVVLVVALSGYAQFWPIALATFATGQGLIVIGTVGLLRRSHLSIGQTLWLLVLYGLLASWDFLAIALALPFLLLGLVSGPLALGICLIAAIGLGLYSLDTLFGITFPGVSGLETSQQAGIALTLLVGSGLVLVWRWQHPDWDIAAAVATNASLRRRLKRAIAHRTLSTGDAGNRGERLED